MGLFAGISIEKKDNLCDTGFGFATVESVYGKQCKRQSFGMRQPVPPHTLNI